MITKCRICGKEFEVLYPELWRYVRAKRYLCSWKCLRQFDEKGSEEMYTKVKKDGTPAKKPGKKTIVDPDVDAKLPEEAPVAKEEKPAFEYKVTGIETTAGDFQYYRIRGYLDWTPMDNDTVSLTVQEWKELIRVLPMVVEKLGVEL